MGRKDWGLRKGEKRRKEKPEARVSKKRTKERDATETPKKR